jgi:hypothetical protein
MKNVFVIFIAILFANTISSQDWIEFTASETTIPSYDLNKSLDTIVEFELLVPGMFSTAIDSFNRVQIKEHLRLDSVGFPEMPQVRLRLCLSRYCPFRLQPEKPVPNASLW